MGFDKQMRLLALLFNDRKQTSAIWRVVMSALVVVLTILCVETSVIGEDAQNKLEEKLEIDANNSKFEESFVNVANCYKQFSRPTRRLGIFATLRGQDAVFESELSGIGSDAYLDATTEDVYKRRYTDGAQVETGEIPIPSTVEASSGRGSTRRSHGSTGLFGMPVETNARDADTFYERWIEPDSSSTSWEKQILPQGLMYPSYLASRKDPRLQSIITYDSDYGTLWDITLGGRAPIFRFGTTDPINPEGWEIELEGAALLRLDWERHRNLAGTDYRAGVPIVYGTRRWQFKTGYYHVSSHLGDNYLMDNFRPRKHYSRDAIMLGGAFKPVDDVRIYAEFDYAFHRGQTTDPLEIQFGFEYAPQFDPTRSNWFSHPFFATHGHLFQERDFGGYWATQAGLQWRSASDSMLRLGAEFYVGGDDLYQFHTTYQRKIGAGLWYDF